jgi:asparagine synthase (glutamine-hydrolysing)
MCGIAGFLAPGHDPSGFARQIAAMLARVGHRGPDAAGAVACDDGALGTARLSIVDVANGDQPMRDPSGRYWIAYNGEVYNHIELRRTLEAQGRVFRTRCDTEVVLQAWLTWGPDCLARLNGGFAFAILDVVSGRLVLARDRFGKRPMFYARHDGAFLFASEMKAFLAVPDFKFRQDPAQLASILAQWTPLPAQTGFEDIASLPLGSWLETGPAGTRVRSYAKLRFDVPPETDQAHAIARIRDSVRQSVALRLRSDVEVGVYLSGGLDSAIVARLVTDITGTPPATFSIGFDDARLDESDAQVVMAQALGSRHHTVRMTARDIAADFATAVLHAELPAFRCAFVPMYRLAALTRANGIKVVLSGEGADEAFLGYDLFKETLLRRQWAELDEATRRTRLASLYPHLDHYGPDDLVAITGLYQQFAKERLPGLFSHELRLQNGRFAARLLRKAGDPFAPILAAVADDPDFAALDPVQKAQWLEYQTLLPGYLLSTQGERMSLAHGVENRCPFLDQNVVDAALASNLRFDDGFVEKRLLRLAFADDLPPAIVQRRKFPYRAPDAAAFQAGRPDWLEAVLSEDELRKLPFLDHRFASALATKAMTRPPEQISTKEDQAFVFLLSIALLHRAFVLREAAAPVVPRVVLHDLRQTVGHSQGNFASVT